MPLPDLKGEIISKTLITFWLSFYLSPTYTYLSERLSLYTKFSYTLVLQVTGFVQGSDPVLCRLPPAWTEWYFFTFVLLMLQLLQTVSPSAPKFSLSQAGEGHRVLTDPCNILLPLLHNICPYRFRYV